MLSSCLKLHHQYNSIMLLDRNLPGPSLSHRADPGGLWNYRRDGDRPQTQGETTQDGSDPGTVQLPLPVSLGLHQEEAHGGGQCQHQDHQRHRPGRRD